MCVEIVSFTLLCQRDSEGFASRLQVMEVEMGNDVAIGGGNFFVRVARDSAGGITRWAIRNIPSGREMSLQGGADLTTFAQECLLEDVRLRSA